MSLEIRVPSLPESVADATVLNWHKQPGDSVAVNENLVDLETDKVVCIDENNPYFKMLHGSRIDIGEKARRNAARSCRFGRKCCRGCVDERDGCPLWLCRRRLSTRMRSMGLPQGESAAWLTRPLAALHLPRSVQ